MQLVRNSKPRAMKVNLTNCTFFLSLLVHTLAYKQLTLRDLCSSIEKRKIQLEKEDNSGLIVSQYNLKQHYYYWGINFKCKFQVSTSGFKEGVIAVIQNLAFRENPTMDDCRDLDYIQFIPKDGSSSQKFCGRFSTDNSSVQPVEHTFGTSVVDSRGELDVVIFVVKERLKQYEEMNIRIVFTAYRNCHDEVVKRNPALYQPCNRIHLEFCIYAGFISDNYRNCPLAHCKDKQGCRKPVNMSLHHKHGVLFIEVLPAFFVMLLPLTLSFICFPKTNELPWWQNFPDSESESPVNEAIELMVIEPEEETGSRSF